MEISIIDEVETTKGLIFTSTIEPSLLKNKILLTLDRAKEYVEKANWKEITKVEVENLGIAGQYLVRIRIG